MIISFIKRAKYFTVKLFKKKTFLVLGILLTLIFVVCCGLIFYNIIILNKFVLLAYPVTVFILIMLNRTRKRFCLEDLIDNQDAIGLLLFLNQYPNFIFSENLEKMNHRVFKVLRRYFKKSISPSKYLYYEIKQNNFESLVDSVKSLITYKQNWLFGINSHEFIWESIRFELFMIGIKHDLDVRFLQSTNKKKRLP